MLNTLGDSEEMRGRLDKGDEIVGRYLNDYKDSFTAREVVTAYENGTMEELVAKARKSLEVTDLYNEWRGLEQEQHPDRFER